MHQTGDRDLSEVTSAYLQHGFLADVRAFIEDVPAEFVRADIVISRAGASSVAELAAAGKASILVPFPHAADNHQYENGRALAQIGAARLIEQKYLTPARLSAELADLARHRHEVKEMEHRVRAFAQPEAAARIADLIEDLAGAAP